MAVKIEGTCDPRFKSVRDIFADSFENGLEVGAAVAATVDGKSVFDLWGGYTDKAKTKPWTRDTLVNVFSTTKGITSMCAHRLVDQGKLDIDAPVSKYWPEFAQAGKEKIPVNYLLTHRAGLPAVRKQLPMDAYSNWPVMCAAIAAQEPWWEPGTAQGYHAITFGYLVGEVIRRITGKTPGTYLREEIAGPHKLDIHIGVDASFDPRIAELIGAPPPAPGKPDQIAAMAADPESMTFKAIANPQPVVDPALVNSREWRGAEIPAANGHATARALAALYGGLATGGELNGYRVLTRASIERAYTEQANGPDLVLGVVSRWGLGFALNQPAAPIGPNPSNLFSVTAEAYYGTDLEKLVNNMQVVSEPGKKYDYMSGNTLVLGMIVEKATGMKLSDYLSEKLWKPIGAALPAEWSLDHKDGMEKAYCCFYSTARDFARFGKLYLDSGVWNGKQIVSKEYAKESLTPAPLDFTGNEPNCYGYQWWLTNEKGHHIFYCRGLKGQYIVVIPDKKIIFVRLGNHRELPEADHLLKDLPVYIDGVLEMCGN